MLQGPALKMWGHSLSEPEAAWLPREFEWTYPRSTEVPCKGAKSSAVETFADAESWVSNDELDLDWAA
jgi:hypothetical protein